MEEFNSVSLGIAAYQLISHVGRQSCFGSSTPAQLNGAEKTFVATTSFPLPNHPLQRCIFPLFSSPAQKQFKMLSIRNFARAAPRTLSRVAGASLRSSAIARPSTLANKSPAIKALLPTRAAAFSTTARRSSKEEDVELDEALSAKLESEIQIEEDIKANEQQPASIKDFLDNSPFELLDTPGQEVVKLTRSYGEEK